MTSKQPKRGCLWFNDASCIRLRSAHEDCRDHSTTSAIILPETPARARPTTRSSARPFGECVPPFPSKQLQSGQRDSWSTKRRWATITAVTCRAFPCPHTQRADLVSLHTATHLTPAATRFPASKPQAAPSTPMFFTRGIPTNIITTSGNRLTTKSTSGRSIV